MGDLKPNISRWEVACKCGCGFDTLDVKTADIVQSLCDEIAESLGLTRVVIHFTSGCRCDEHNFNEDGSDDSQHLYGRAVDFWIEGVDPAIVYERLSKRYDGMYGVGKYKDFTHFDTRSGPAWRSEG